MTSWHRRETLIIGKKIDIEILFNMNILNHITHDLNNIEIIDHFLLDWTIRTNTKGTYIFLFRNRTKWAENGVDSLVKTIRRRLTSTSHMTFHTQTLVSYMISYIKILMTSLPLTNDSISESVRQVHKISVISRIIMMNTKKIENSLNWDVWDSERDIGESDPMDK